MWIRSAFWVGQSRADSEFRAAVDDELIPALKSLPGVDNAQALWPRRLEDDPPAIYCQVILRFASLDALNLMLASPQRQALRTRVREISQMFDGKISHIDYEVV